MHPRQVRGRLLGHLPRPRSRRSSTATRRSRYVRMRHGINTSGSDLDRIDRQQEFLKNLASKVLSAQMLYRPQDVTNFIKAVADSLTVDHDLGNLDYVGGLAYSLRSINPSTGITFATAPIEAYPPNPKNRVQFSGKATAIWRSPHRRQADRAAARLPIGSPANERRSRRPC